MHARINSLGRRQQEKAVIAQHMREFESRVMAYTTSLGQPDDQADESQAAPVAVAPGVK